VGCIGLIKALDNFDTSHNVKFSTYAVPMIIGEIRRYLRDNNTIRVSRSLRDMAYKALQAKEKLMRQSQREPTVSEIAKELEATVEEVVIALNSIQDPISLFEPVFHDDGDALYVMDQVKDTVNTDEKWMENISLSEAMNKLTDKERNILSMRFFEGRTQMEVAEEIGISQAQVSRLEKNALLHMRKYV
jgi:RNA polymerase sporulation-specific sigma factor